jgi:hypothetical protein
MTDKTAPLGLDSWVWVIVQDPDAGACYFGQVDDRSQEAFIPAFYKKEDALQCLGKFASVKGPKREVQAVCFGDLCQDAAANGFLITMLDADGQLLEKITPPAR